MNKPDYGPSVIRHENHDYWRTWFLDECDDMCLLGITAELVPRMVTPGPGVSSYHVGTELFLEDAPWFLHSERRTHRICGPYVVKGADAVPEDTEVVHEVDGQIVVYRDPHPERGPWHNRSKVERLVDGEVVVFRQIAGQFDHFPYRVRIVRSPRWRVDLIWHSPSCWLCDAVE